jgi:protein O-GlcNAc transferase
MKSMRNKRKFHLAPPTLSYSLESEILKANALAGAGRIDESMEALTRQLVKFPGRSEILLAMGRILLQAERFADAIDVLVVLRAHLPTNGEVAKMLGMVYGHTRQYSKSNQELEDAKRMTPSDPEVYLLMAKNYEHLGRQGQALESIQAAMNLSPGDVNLQCSAAASLHHAGRGKEASAILLENPAISGLPEVRLLEAMLFPVIPESEAEIRARREHYRKALLELEAGNATFRNPEKTIVQTNFLLGYHGFNDRELLELSARTLLKVCPELNYTSPNLARKRLGERRIKFGVVSSNMRNHSVGRVLNRFLKELDRVRFEVTLFELPGKFDGGQELARGYADRTIFVPAELSSARRIIEEAEPDILMFPDFVLDPTTDRLAFSRLAPVQCTTWGHPGSSGRPSIDYWISCEDWEPEGNERFYSEKLVRLTQPPMIATPLPRPAQLVGREELGLPPGRIYGCPQSIYKLHPSFDEILAQVLEQDPEGHVVLIGSVQNFWLGQFRTRFSAKFGSLLDRVVTLPTLETPQYMSLLAHCSVSLDPTHFGGANTSMEAFTMGLPVVTWPGDQVRNRQTFSFYKMMDFMDLVVDSQREYVDLAIRVAMDERLRARYSSIIQERCSVIFDTIEITRELERFFENAIGDALGGPIR